nr:unnamed protein product [Spirometra erinaceieuropaei]
MFTAPSPSSGIVARGVIVEVLSKVERDALRELKADKDLLLVPADKGRSTVVLDRTDYLQKVKGLLEDRQFYVPCATNPLKALTREINATLLALENSGAITPTDRRMARPQDTALARFYGLPKVHKDGTPVQFIVSLKGTPTHGLAKWLFRRLKFLTAESDTTVSSSAQFLEKLKGDLAIETIELLLQSKYDETENRLGRAQVLQLSKLCLRTYFTFDGTIYEQVKGTPMGSQSSGFIAEAVLQRLESLVFQHHRPKFWARYVDDTFVVIERDQVLTFQEHLNAAFPDIQFTMEEEENNQLAFLDVLVCRKDCGGLKTKVFRKATDTTQATTIFAADEDIQEGQLIVFLLLLHRKLNVREDGVEMVFDLAIETIELLLPTKYDETENRLGRAQVLQLLMFCIRAYFTFDGTIYEQVKGTPTCDGKENVLVEALSRIWMAYVTTYVIEFTLMAEARRSDNELSQSRHEDSSLRIQVVPLPTGTGAITGDLSTGHERPFVPATLRRQVFKALHNLFYLVVRATVNPITDRFVWPNINRDVRR